MKGKQRIIIGVSLMVVGLCMTFMGRAPYVPVGVFMMGAGLSKLL